ncbi:MAG: PAS domain S-box protein [Bacteroidales bacterium]|nr:PAS domain S-box protein [Candidatus Latescibacterota bacterium]
MNINREKKIFNAVLWSFLAGALVFYISMISTGRIILPAPVWFMFLLLDAGFIVFMFIPYPGRMPIGKAPGPGTESKWYPRSMSDIVEKSEDEKKPSHAGILEVGRAIGPVPLIPLLLLIPIILLSMSGERDIDKWQEQERDKLLSIYGDAAARVADVERLAMETGRSVVERLGVDFQDTIDSVERAGWIDVVDSLAHAAGNGVEPFGHLGIQVFSTSGKRVLWGGTPRFAGRAATRESSRSVFISRTQLFTLLVHETELPDGSRILIDIPLEVDYRINNRFLRSEGIGLTLSKEYGEDVDCRFWRGGVSRKQGWDTSLFKNKGPNIYSEEGGNVRVYGLIESSMGQPLAQLNVTGRSFRAMLSDVESSRIFKAGLLIVLCVIIIARHVYRVLANRKKRDGNRIWNSVSRLAVLVSFLALIRYILIRLEIPSRIFGSNLFDPSLFADNLPGGLTRTTGDLLLTALFFLILVFGGVKIFRTYYRGFMERSVDSSGRVVPVRLALKAVLSSVVLLGVVKISGMIVARTVLNSNPRLIGLDTEFFSVPVLSLHLALLLSVSAVLIAGIFLLRVIFVWGGGRLFEWIPAAGLALAAVIYLAHPHWSLTVASVALVLISARIFPMLRKEEALTVIFASFFLVLICSLVVFGTAFEKYDELRKSKVIERLKTFNDPDDNWLMLVLPDVCEGIFNSRSAVAKVLSGNRSTAFELWADSGMSRFGFSCVFDVYNAGGRQFSRFSVGMPIEVLNALPGAVRSSPLPEVKKVLRETREGKVHFLVGIAPLYNLNGVPAGRVEIKVPYFYENPELLVKAGPMAPEIFQNIESGTLAPRIDEPENLLVARLRSDRVIDSSSPVLPAGSTVGGLEGEWFDVGSDGVKYTCTKKYREGEDGFLAGYRNPGLNEKILQWAMVVSLNIILTVVSMIVLFLTRKLPFLGSVTPAVSFAGGLSFRRKLLLSFLAVSVMPVILMGIFSGRYIRYRFRAEGEREAVTAVRSAQSFLRHSIRSEAEAFSESRYLGEVLIGSETPRIGDMTRFPGMQFTLWDGKGNLLLDESLSDFSSVETSGLIASSESGKVMISYSYPHLYAGTVIYIPIPGRPAGYLYYRRRLDDDFISELAAVLGRNLNIYFEGLLRVSSERELFTGGFLEPLLSPPVYSEVALGRARIALRDQNLGDYTYKVAGISLPTFRSEEMGVLSVPLLYRTAYIRNEMLRSYALILGLLALLFSAAVTLGVFLAGKIINPISALLGGTKRIITGDLEFRLEAEAQDEIGDLVDSFNTMTGALRVARRDLVERQRYLSAILENVAAGVVSTESDGSVVTVNPSAARMLGMDPGELVGRKISSLSRDELKPFTTLFEHRGEKTREDEISLFSGEDRRTFKAVITSLREGGEDLGTVVVFDDLTELIRTKKLSAWVEMARQIAHEVKNPLTPIKLSAQLMRRAYREDSEEFPVIFEEGVDTVIQQTEILRRIASEFSSFGRAVDLRPEAIDAGGFIESIVSGYRGAGQIKVIHEAGDPAVLMADMEALRKILVNLIENAMDAISERGQVVVTHRVTGDKVEIIVVDSGSGLPPEVEERLFEPYFSTKTNGTGLGLAICRSLATEMGGDISLGNIESGNGVRAVVNLPLA